MDKEVLVWDQERGPHLDYLRVYFHKFSTPEESFGKPDLQDDVDIYGWANIPYDPTNSYQTRRVFILEPQDLGGYKFTLEDCDTREYPDKVIDAHNIEAGDSESVEEPTPKFRSSANYQLTDIPDRIHPTEDTARFKTVRCTGFELELETGFGDTTRLNLNRDFSTYTLIKMTRELDDFELPPILNNYIVSNQI